jgi:hypothetical protein
MEKSIDDKLREYYDKLDRYSDLLPKDVKEDSILLHPSNELELTLADSELTYMIDSSTLIPSILMRGVRVKKVEDNLFTKLLYDYYDVAFLNKDEKKRKELINKMIKNPIYAARLSYDTTLSTYQEEENVAKKLAHLCFTGAMSFDEISLLLDTLQEEVRNCSKNMSVVNHMLFVKEFHKCCEEGKLMDITDTQDFKKLLEFIKNK